MIEFIKNKKIILILIILFGFFGVVKSSQAAVDLPWSTTYDCDEWMQVDSTPLNCDGIARYGGWTTTDGNGDLITTSANNPTGAGGKGQRSWYGDGTNNNSGTLQVTLNTPQSELWIRIYMKYPLGFTWKNGYPHYDKLLYIDTGLPGAIVPEFYGNEINVWLAWNSLNVSTTGSKGWPNIMNGATGDGLWHCYEWHIKADKDNTNGVAQLWIDGILLLDRHDVNYYGTNNTWSHIHWPSNQDYVLNGQDVPVDYDDVSIYNTTPPNTDAQGNPFIGPIGWAGSDTTPPSHPTGLSVS